MDPSTLAAWLLGQGPVPPAQALRAAGLSAYAYAVLPAEHPIRAALRDDYLSSLARHLRIKAELLPLVRAWNEAGIVPLLFKGFHLSEFVYPVPGARFHGDVDVLVRPEQTDRAARIAAGLGWGEEAGKDAMGVRYFHYACNLTGPGGVAYVDLHRWAIHCSLPWTHVQRRITQAVWEASRERVWEGVRVREMDESDAVLVGVVLSRSWSNDRWRLKPHDVVDIQLLASRGVTREALLARAGELRGSRTLRRFLDRCDPLQGRLRLDHPGRAETWRSDLSALGERGPLGAAQLWLSRAFRAPQVVRDVVRGLRWVIRARRALHRNGNLEALLESLSPAVEPGSHGSVRQRFRTVDGIRVAAASLRTNRGGDCLVRSLAIYAALRAQGWNVRFVSGMRRDTAGGVLGHAWVEYEGRVLWELNEVANRRLYRVNFAYPPEELAGE